MAGYIRYPAATSGTNTGDVSLAAVGSSPNANSASLSGQVLNLQPADGSNPGILTSGTQTIGGTKTFTGRVFSQAASSAGSVLLTGGLLYRNAQNLTNTSTGETDLGTYTVLANTLSADYNALLIHAFFSLANNANSKTIKFYYGASSVTLFSATTANITFGVWLELCRTGASTQRVTYTLVRSDSTSTAGTTTFSITDSSNQIVKMTGQGGASNDIIENTLSVRFEPAS